MSLPRVRVRKKLTRIEPTEATLPFLESDSAYVVEPTGVGKEMLPTGSSLCDIPLFMHKDVYKGILDYASHRKDIEVGGALLGRYCIDDRKEEGSRHFLVVECVIHLKVGYWCTRSHLHFPHEFIWALDNYLTEQKNVEPNLLRLGFYHTHPGYGIFLSQTDLDTFRSFFSADWHVAMVVDPVNHDEGVFYLRGDKLSPKCPIWLLVPHHRSKDRQFPYPRSVNSIDMEETAGSGPQRAEVEASGHGGGETVKDAEAIPSGGQAPETEPMSEDVHGEPEEENELEENEQEENEPEEERPADDEDDEQEDDEPEDDEPEDDEPEDVEPDDGEQKNEPNKLGHEGDASGRRSRSSEAKTRPAGLLKRITRNLFGSKAGSAAVEEFSGSIRIDESQ